MNTQILIKFKTLDSQEHSVKFDPKLKIEKLKSKISRFLDVDQKNLLIIFRGKKLENKKKLSDYDFEEGKTLNVIARKLQAKKGKKNIVANKKRKQI